MISVLMVKFRSLVLFFLNIFRRAMCCFRRKRRLSCDEDQLSHIVVKSTEQQQDVEQWNDWEFKNRRPESVQEHIEYYRQQQAKLAKQQSQDDPIEEEDNRNLFEDMTPKITRQAKVVIKGSGGNGEGKARSLDVQHDDDTFVRKELENWEENSGWDNESLDWNAQQLLREKKRQERERRAWEQQQKRLEKGNRPNVLGSKINN